MPMSVRYASLNGRLVAEERLGVVTAYIVSLQRLRTRSRNPAISLVRAYTDGARVC